LTEALTEHLNEMRRRVDDHLPLTLRRVESCPPSLIEAIRYSLLAPGKRLRPILVLLAAEAAGGEMETALDAACAVEMVHTYSLIHDDLPAMDDDDLRRGLPTCHKKFGEALAILAGDALLTLAFGVLAEAYPPGIAAPCVRELARGAGAAGMVGGQVDDLAEEKAGTNGRLTDLERIHAHKTGALFRACLRIGYWIARGEQDSDVRILEGLDGYGRCFGQAFQITDDLLDVESTQELTGKRVGKDAAKGKLTYPGLIGIEASRKKAQEQAEQAVRHLSPLGRSGEKLALLVQWIVKRDR
jgi:geranylgeranyl diphosphate synthase type II